MKSKNYNYVIELDIMIIWHCIKLSNTHFPLKFQPILWEIHGDLEKKEWTQRLIRADELLVIIILFF